MFGDIQLSGTRNRLTRPIAVIGGREAYKQLCRICDLNPENNDVFKHVGSVRESFYAEYSRVIEIDGAEDVKDRLAIASAAHAAIRN